MRTLLVIYLACLTIASLQVARFGWRHDGALHRLSHMACFAALAGLAAWGPKQRRRVLLAMLAAIALGAAIELAQHLIYHNPYEWADLRDDAIGACAGAALLAALPAFRGGSL